MSEKLSNAPVYYALAQARFNPVAAMAKYVDEVQDRLRREGYTLFEARHETLLQISGKAPMEPKVVSSVSWHITKGDLTAGFILNQASITFHTTHYETNEAFIPELLRGLKIVHEIVQLEHLRTLGLRYLNAVLPRSGETIDQYLADGLQGVQFQAKQRYARFESAYETEVDPLLPKGTLVARVHRIDARLGFPPDLNPYELKVPEFAANMSGLHALIDMDHFVEGPMSLDFDKIGEQLSNLHATLKHMFKAIVSEHALSAVWIS